MNNNIINNRYEILEEIGSGGMAIVYKAHDVKLDRIVAVKTLRESLVNNQEFIARLKKEAQSAARLSHINITAVYDIDLTDNLHYIIMEYVDGISLKNFIKDQEKIKWEESLNIMIQTAKALENAHKNNIIHRDIKPDNILINEEGIIKVSDFGIAKVLSASTQLTKKGMVMGSLHYMSPEQIQGKEVDARTDIYSLGVTFYEMVTGYLPFVGDNIMSIAKKHLSDDPIPPIKKITNIPPIINDIILKSLKKNPDERYENVNDLLIDLNKALRTSNLFKETVFLHNKIYDNNIENKKSEKLNYNSGNKSSNSNRNLIYLFMIFCVVIISLLIVFKSDLISLKDSGRKFINANQIAKSNQTEEPKNLHIEEGSKNVNKIINSGLENYYNSLINSINESNFSYVEPTLVTESTLYYAQQELIQSLSNQNIKEKLISYEINNIVDLGNLRYKIYVEETIGIRRFPSDNYVNSTFKFIYWLQIDNSQVKFSNIEKWIN